MTPREQFDDLARILRAAVDDIEPRSGLDAIRTRLDKDSAAGLSGNRLLGAVGAALATAAAITVVIVGVKTTTGPAVDGSTTSPGPSEASLPPATAAVPVYYVGQTPSGLKLYREFHQVRSSGVYGRLQATVDQAVLVTPIDPDYQSLWKGVSKVKTSYNGEIITVDLFTDDVRPLQDGSGLSAEEQKFSVQQVIYTAQAGLGDGRRPVRFLINGDHTDAVLGQPASEPLTNDSVLETNSHVQLSTPSEGEVITNDRLRFSGAANSFEATVGIQLRRDGVVVYQGSAMAQGAYADRLFPFSGSIDVSDLAPGTYVLTAMEDDPSGGAEGASADSDTRAIQIE